MAKNKRRRRTTLLTKAINVGILLLAFSRPLQIALGGGGPGRIGELMVLNATAGMVRPSGVTGKFDQGIATSFYGPMVAAIVLKKAISMVRKTARV